MECDYDIGRRMTARRYSDSALNVVVSFRYYWGKDLSESLQGDGGIGGLLCFTCDGDVYGPVYDQIGNIVAVVDSSGTEVASFVYDAFGRTVSSSGSACSFVHYRFSTKYWDEETGMCYYGYRFYVPRMGRWLNRDPIEEEGNNNVYLFCRNHPVSTIDLCGLLEVLDNSSGSKYSAKALKMYFEISMTDGTFQRITEPIREPFRAAIRVHFKSMVFVLKNNEQCVDCNTNDNGVDSARNGVTPHLGVFQDIVVRSNHTLPNGTVVPVITEHRKQWNHKAILCVSQLCNKKSMENWLRTAIHETAHNVGWGNYYEDKQDPSFSNLSVPPVSHPKDWSMPYGSD